MQKKNYIKPVMRCYEISKPRILQNSVNMRWSGNKSGDSKPGEIDEYSTWDSF